MSFMGIDVGTSGCKAAVFNAEGRMLSLVYAEYDYLHKNPGWAELDTMSVWQQIKHTIAKAAADAIGDPIQALSVSSLGEAVVPIGANRQILGGSLLNFDTRGDEYLQEWQGSISREQLYRINGNTPGNQYTMTKLKWLKEHQPELYRQTRWFLHWSGFVSFMLGADPHVDYSLANRTLLFDLDHGDWSDELLNLANLERDKLPPTVPSGRIIGTLSQVVARELSLPVGIPIISGGHDQCCNGVGCGVITPGQAMYGMGTYICMMPVFDRRPDPDSMMARGLNTEHHAVAGQFVSFIYNQGGAVVKWFRDTFASSERQLAEAGNLDLYAILMSEMPETLSQVMVLPHFTATGPPEFIVDSSGVIAGLKLETRRGEILKGILEATTFYIRESFENLPGAGIEIHDFRAVGGGSKSDAWIQVCADILGRSFIRPRVNEAGALGAAILAGTGCGFFPTLEAGVENMVHLDKRFDPDPTRQTMYDQRFGIYRQFWPLMANYLRELNKSLILPL